MLDPDATVDLYCDTKVLIPVLRPARERWFEVAIVADASPTMSVWRDTVAALADLLERHGAFRAVTRWRLAERPDGTAVVRSPSGVEHEPRQLSDDGGQRLVLVVTDAVGALWRRDAAWSAVRLWGATCPVALVHLLPDRMWGQTATGEADIAVRAHRAGEPNARLDVRAPWWWEADEPPWGAIPVLALDEASIAPWARLVSGVPGVAVRAVLGIAAEDFLDEAALQIAEPELLGDAIRSSVSSTAYRLAALLSAVDVSLPVARVVMAELLPEARHVHLAELLAAGVLRATGDDDQRGDDGLEFAPGVRSQLQQSLTTTDVLRAWRAITPILTASGRQPQFSLLLTEGAEALGGEPDPMARIAADLANRLGLIGLVPGREPATTVMAGTTPEEWWESPRTDWTRGEPSRLVDVLATAYPGIPAIRRLSVSAGIAWPAPLTPGTARETWALVLGQAAAGGLVFDLIAEVMQDAASEPFRPLLESLLGDRLVFVTARQTFRHGLAPPPDGPDPLVESLVEVPNAPGDEPTSGLEAITAVTAGLEDPRAMEVPNAPGDEPTSGLEAITAVTAGLEDPRAMVQAIVEATRRTAVIEINGVAKGTGILVGPDLLLTAAHVIDRKAWPPDPRPEVVARFDYGRQTTSHVRDVVGGEAHLVPDRRDDLPVPVRDHLAGGRAETPDPLAQLDHGTAPGSAGEADHVGEAHDERPRTPAENGIPVPVIDFLAASPPAEAKVEGRTADWEAPADRLDFVLLRLGSAVPPVEDADETQTRGNYWLDTTEYDFTRSPLMFIVQHPIGQSQRVTWIRSVPEQNAGRTRIRYGGKTLPGSSGSPVVDVRGRLVGLHHYSEGGRNQAVPLAAIAKAIAGQVTVPPVAPPPLDGDPFLANSLRGKPFVNRANLRGRLREMVHIGHGRRVLTITGDSGSGVSYSYQLISHIAQSQQLRAAVPGGLAALLVNVADYLEFGVEERREHIARDILVGLGLPYTGEALLQVARSITRFRQALRAGLRDSPQQWWIFVDGLDQLVAVQQGDLDELIHALVLIAEDEQIPLRVVLAGREAELFAVERSLWVQQDVAVGLGRSEVEAWFRDRAREERQVLDEHALAAAMTELFPEGIPPPEPRRLAPQLPQRLLELLEASRES
ncbi:serine protease (plasmid) [Pseudonocardia sp. DSM 110487]|nr:serine protease [Pseudonocardia sp. DSM 110487]